MSLLGVHGWLTDGRVRQRQVGRSVCLVVHIVATYSTTICFDLLEFHAKSSLVSYHILVSGQDFWTIGREIWSLICRIILETKSVFLAMKQNRNQRCIWSLFHCAIGAPAHNNIETNFWSLLFLLLFIEHSWECSLSVKLLFRQHPKCHSSSKLRDNQPTGPTSWEARSFGSFVACSAKE